MTTGAQSALGALERAAQQILPSWVAFAVTDPRMSAPPLMESELAATKGMVPKRKQEFSAGRYAARQAMRALGHPVQPIRMAPDRAPIWPVGLTGSLSHCETVCIAIMTSRQALLGADVEENAPLDADLVDLICSVEERKWCNAGQKNALKRARQIFAAKEAAYKAQYPMTKEVLDFKDIRVSPSGVDDSYDVTFNRDVGSFQVGEGFSGRLRTTSTHILAVVTQPI